MAGRIGVPNHKRKPDWVQPDGTVLVYGTGCNAATTCFECPLPDCLAYMERGKFVVPDVIVKNYKVVDVYPRPSNRKPTT